MNDVFIRLATKEDAVFLQKLNDEFNGVGVSVDFIQESLEKNTQEIICVAEVNGKVIAFCCAQIVKSMCYTTNHAELTELFVHEDYRRRGIAKSLIKFIENICISNGIKHFKLLTGYDNYPAQELYKSLGYTADDEILFLKYTE